MILDSFMEVLKLPPSLCLAKSEAAPLLLRPFTVILKIFLWMFHFVHFCCFGNSIALYARLDSCLLGNPVLSFCVWGSKCPLQCLTRPYYFLLSCHAIGIGGLMYAGKWSNTELFFHPLIPFSVGGIEPSALFP